MFKIDLHTHSSASKDGGILPSDYKKILEERSLDFIAITDHNTLDLAQELKQVHGNKIIVGEEIDTVEGEVIGLFLKKHIERGKTVIETANEIRNQGGLVYIPHPFETTRRGLTESALDTIKDLVDIVEVHNGRAVFENRGPRATTWARVHSKSAAASSDAHGIKGLFNTYTTIKGEPNAKNLGKLLDFGYMTISRPPLSSLLYPKYHRLRKKWSRTP